VLFRSVATFYEMETGRELRRSNGVVRLKELPWVMASLDRTIVGEEGLVEIKTSTSPRWSLHPVPPEVVAQVQWQMFVTAAPWVDIAVLLGGLVFRIERVEADIKYQTQLYAKAVEFRNALATDTPPILQGEDSDALAKVVPQTSEEWAQADTSLDRLAAIYAEKLYETKLHDQELQNLAISLKEAIGEKVGIVGEGWSATWKQNKSSQKIDYKLLLEALKPSVDVVDAYTREVPGARVFKFKTEEGL
jgi:predicted phage-related endonuclease